MHTPRLLLAGFALVALAFTTTAARGTPPQQARPHAAARPVITVYKSPTCGCCKQWVEHVRAAGFDARVVDLDDAALDARKAALGVAPALQSCHTAVVDGYVIEGHVPAADIQRLLRERPAIVGLAAPGMPRGSPGMEMPNGARDAYTVVAFARNAAPTVFARH
jgi:hypothetical protein